MRKKNRDKGKRKFNDKRLVGSFMKSKITLIIITICMITADIMLRKMSQRKKNLNMNEMSHW